MSKTFASRISFGAWVCLLLLHTACQMPHLQLDFWNDELYSLQHFILIPARQIISSYPVPNNHILFSLLAHGWASLAGIGTLQSALQHIFWLRLLPFLFSCLSILFVFLAARKLETGNTALLASLLLITCIPFFNFSAQLRGYSLSMCLFAAEAYFILAAWKNPGLKNLSIVLLLSVALMYTLPTNALFLISTLIILGAGTILFRKKSVRSFEKNTVTRISLAVALGTVLGGLLYLPLLPQMQAWHHSDTQIHSILFESLRLAMPVVAYHFLSARYLILLPLIVYLWKAKRQGLVWLWSLGLLFLSPFFLVGLGAMAPPHRVFLTALPILCLGLGYAWSKALDLIQGLNMRNLTLAVLCLYCLVVFGFQIQKTKRVAENDLEQGIRRLDLYYQYNLNFFHPQADAREYLWHFSRPGIPLLNECVSENDLWKYMLIEGRNATGNDSLSLAQALQKSDTVDVCIERPDRLIHLLPGLDEHWVKMPLLTGRHRVQIVRLSRLPN